MTNHVVRLFLLPAVSAGDSWSGVSDLANEGIYICPTGVPVINDTTAFFRPPEPDDGTAANFMFFSRDVDYFLKDMHRHYVFRILCEKARP